MTQEELDAMALPSLTASPPVRVPEETDVEPCDRIDALQERMATMRVEIQYCGQ